MQRLRTITAAGVTTLALTACLFTLDESRIPVDAETTAAPDGSPSPSSVAPASFGETCGADSDCRTNHGCYTGLCDLVTLTCTYTSCRRDACTAGRCTGSGTCEDVVARPFLAQGFPVEGGIGCNGTPGRCLAAVHPYLFVGTTLGVRAYATARALGEVPGPVAVEGVTFSPEFIVPSRRRVYFVARAKAPYDPSKELRVAWIDVPSDPTRGELRADSVVLGLPRNDLSQVFPAPGGSLLFVTPHPSGGILTGRAPLPLTDGGVVRTYALQGPGDAGPPFPAVVAVSGERLVLFEVGTATSPNQPRLGFVLNAGTDRMHRNPINPVAGLVGPVVSGPPYAFATSPGGAVAWNQPRALLDAGADARAPSTRVAAMRATWLTNDGRDPEIYGQAAVDVERFDPSASSSSASSLAWVDDLLVSLTELDEDRRKTRVTAATKADGGAVLGRAVLDLQTSQTAVVASNGLAFVLEARYPDASFVRVLAPRCAP